MSTQTTGTIAVFGATGQQGGAVVEALLDRKARVRALVRNPESGRAQALAARGVELAAIRTDDPASLVAALTAVEAFYFMTPAADSLEEIEAEIRVGTALVDAAVAARVPHVVFNSIFGADREAGVPHHDSKHWIEEHLRQSGLRAAMVRPTVFMENFASVMAPRLEHGEIVLRMPLPDDAALKMISVRDIGRVAAAILLDVADVPDGAIELVGDELTGPQIAAAFGARAGLPARYEALPLSVLPSDLDKAMFRQFAKAAEYPSDLAAVRAIEPATLDLAEWIRATGWTVSTSDEQQVAGTALAEKAAGTLLGAYSSGSPVPPLTVSQPGLSVADAYAIQLAQVAAWTAGGAVVKGHKVGLTSAAMQRQLGVDQHDFGHLLDAMFLPEGVTADIGRFLQPKAEPEIAFVLGRPLRGPGVTVAEALAAVDFVLPALEIIDSRIADWKIALADTIADNASSGAVVLGGHPVRPDALDLSLTGCLLYRNGRIEGSGAGGAVLGSPVNALAWLANTLGPLGVGLDAGHVVLPGSVCAAIPFGPGDTVSASFDRIGSVSITFSEK